MVVYDSHIVVCVCVLLPGCRETAGVPVRVELGPKDAEQGTCVVALAGEPGTVAKKKTVNVTVELRKEIERLMPQVRGWL